MSRRAVTQQRTWVFRNQLQLKNASQLSSLQRKVRLTPSTLRASSQTPQPSDKERAPPMRYQITVVPSPDPTLNFTGRRESLRLTERRATADVFKPTYGTFGAQSNSLQVQLKRRDKLPFEDSINGATIHEVQRPSPRTRH